MSEEMYGKLAQAVIAGEPEQAVELAKQALDQGLDPLACMNEGLTRGINRVGELFSSGEYFLPDLVIGGDAMNAALAVLEPALVGDQERETPGRVVLGTVEGDIHEIGKTLVGKEQGATLVGASALLTTTMPEQQKIIEALEGAGLREEVKVMVGGAPVSQSWADKIGADGYAENAMSAVDLAFRLVDAPA